MSLNKRRATVLHGQQLECKNGCGFYGNPEWQGYCSKCYRELNQKVKVERATKSSSKKVARSLSDVHDSSLSLTFSKFEEKKKQQSEKRSKTIKSIIKRGHTVKEISTVSPSRDLYPIDVSQLSKNLPLKDHVMKDVIKQMHKQLEIMNKHFDKSVDEQSEIMQDFYNFMSNRCETHPHYQEMTTEEIDLLMDKIEEQLMNYLHRTLFQQISSEYEEKDLALQKRIRSLNWITAQHLYLDLKENSPDVRDLIDKAITDVIEMDSKIAPQEKINCIVNCSKNIFNIINLCQGVTASADEFLPAMVYIVLKANPPLLQSNIKYITSYRIPARLRSGEGAYYFTNLCCAVAFIEDLTAESLNLTSEEFELYLSGEVPPDNSESGDDASSCEGMRLLLQKLAALNEIQAKNNQLLNDMVALRDDMTKFEDTISKQKPTSPLKISPTPYKVPSGVDMSLIPELLRCRVICEDSTDYILVDIDNKTEVTAALPAKNGETVMTESLDNSKLSNFNCSSVLSDLDGVTLEDKCKSDFPLGNIQSLHVALPMQSCDHTSSSETVSQPVVNIKDLEYPTEIFPDSSSELDCFAGSEGLNQMDFMSADKSSKGIADPLSPESEFMEESLNLPPPLQPVVVQKMNTESDKKS